MRVYEKLAISLHLLREVHQLKMQKWKERLLLQQQQQQKRQQHQQCCDVIIYQCRDGLG
jgi:hypothetical protein